jgi:hypothetical protein
MPAWEDFPGDDMAADTALMNLRLQGYIDTMPGPVLLGAQAVQDPATRRAGGLLSLQDRV